MKNNSWFDSVVHINFFAKILHYQSQKYDSRIFPFVMEALKPAKVVGIQMGEGKSATVVVKDDSLSLAIGRKGVNVRLAVRLTGYNIDIKIETEAIDEGFEYQSLVELQAEEDAKRQEAVAKVEEGDVSNNWLL